MKLAIYYLTCKDIKEARKISDILLSKKLIVCAKEIPAHSSFIWKKNIENADEILLFFESIIGNFDVIEKEIRKIHSYETFILVELPVNKTTKDVREWIEDSLE